MAKIRLTGATFDASAQTIVHASFSDVGLSGIQLIVNVTDQIIIYNFADTTKGWTLSTDTLTLEYNTTTMSDTDDLMILVEDGISSTGKQDTIISHIDGVESLLWTTNATLSTIDGRVDGLESSNTAIQTAVELIDDTVKVLGTDTFTEATSKGMVIGAVRRDADTTLVNTTNEFWPLQMDANGRLKVEAFSGETLPVLDTNSAAIAASLSVMDDWDNAASDGASISGDVAHDTADSGEPVKIGMKAYEHDGTAPQWAVAEWDRVNAIADLTGRQYVAMEHPRYFHVSADYASAQTNTSIQASPWAWLALNITGIVISNGATAGNITLLNGSWWTVLFEIYPWINGWVSISLINPIKLSDATALCITSTTVTTHSVFISGFID
jgi:hypothetical protein